MTSAMLGLSEGEPKLTLAQRAWRAPTAPAWHIGPLNRESESHPLSPLARGFCMKAIGTIGKGIFNCWDELSGALDLQQAVGAGHPLTKAKLRSCQGHGLQCV